MVGQLTRVKEMLKPGCFDFCNHCRAAKKRMRNITYARGANKTKLYKELLQYTKQTKTYLALAISLTEHVQDEIVFSMLQLEAENLIRLIDKVIYQTERRVLQGEKVPHEEKVFSIFETHTDIIIKGARDIQYGHKLNLTTSKSGLVLDIFIEQGNPADTARLCPMIDQQQEIYG
jgi:IS5 family transposase